MSDTTTTPPQPRTRPVAPVTPGAAGSSGSHLGKLRLVDPLDVFAGFAAACVPAFCDGLRIELAIDGRGSIDVAYPAADVVDGDGHLPDDADGHLAEPREPGQATVGQISIAVSSDATAGEAPIAGTISCSWHDSGRPTESDAVMAGLLADQALAKVRLQLLASALQEQRERGANLEVALATNREIGQAIGILMATGQLTATQAFERLRTTSQHSHRKLRDIAADVTETGVLPDLTVPQAASAIAELETVGEPDRAGQSAMRSVRCTRVGQPLAAPND